MKVKSSVCIPPDPDTAVEALKLVHYAVYIWLRCFEVNAEIIAFCIYRWKWCKEQTLVLQVCFIGHQLLLPLKKRRKKEGEEEEDIKTEINRERKEGTKKRKLWKYKRLCDVKTKASVRHGEYKTDDEVWE